MMKKLILILAIFLCGRSGHAQAVMIYHIGVGQGDATLILIKSAVGDTVSILIDAGNSKSKGTLTYQVVNRYLGGRKNIDFIIVSHLHSDHLGGMIEFLDDLYTYEWTIGAIFDRAAGNNPGSDDLCYDNINDVSNDDAQSVPSSQLVKRYKKKVNDILEDGKIKAGWLNLNVGVDLLHAAPTLLPASFKASTMVFRSLAGNGYVCTKASDYSASKFFAAAAHNENDFSYAFLFEMGQFKYFTGGDIGGERPYVDLETPLVNLFKTRGDNATFHFCGYKATHHGSVNSTNLTFVNYTKPTVTVVPSALRSFSGTQLPGQATLQRIANSSTNRYIHYTYRYTTNAYSGSVNAYRDVSLLVDSTNFANSGAMVVESQLRDKKSLSTMGGTTTENDTCKKHGGFMMAQSPMSYWEDSNVSSPDAPLVQPLEKIKPAANKKRLFRYKRKRR